MNSANIFDASRRVLRYAQAVFDLEVSARHSEVPEFRESSLTISGCPRIRFSRLDGAESAVTILKSTRQIYLWRL